MKAMLAHEIVGLGEFNNDSRELGSRHTGDSMAVFDRNGLCLHRCFVKEHWGLTSAQ
jgi:hypothetical protein